MIPDVYFNLNKFIAKSEIFHNFIIKFVAVNVRLEPAPTQLPVKIVSAELNASPRWESQNLLWFCIMFVCHFSL